MARRMVSSAAGNPATLMITLRACGTPAATEMSSCGTGESSCGIPAEAPRGFKVLPVAAVEAGACCGPAPVAEAAGCGCSAESPAEMPALQLVGADATRGNGGCCG